MPVPDAALPAGEDANIGSLRSHPDERARVGTGVRLGVGTQLSMGFIAVAVFGLTANLLLKDGDTAVRTRVERLAPEVAFASTDGAPSRARTETTAPIGAGATSATTAGATAAPGAAPDGLPGKERARPRAARATRPAPSPEALVATLAEFDRRILASLPGADPDVQRLAGRTPLEAIPATDEEVRAAIDAAAARFTRDAVAVGAPPMTLRELRNQLSSHQAAGLALQSSAARRDAQLQEFQRSRGALEAQLRQPLDRSLKLFGRTFARESVIAINRGFDAIRQAAAEIDGPPPLRPTAAEQLAMAEGVFGRLLVEHDASLAKSQGPQWTAGVRARFEALAAARGALLQTDAAHAATLAHFAGDTPAITESIRALSRRLARQQADAAALAAAHSAARAEEEAGRALETGLVATAAAAAELAASADAARVPQPGAAPTVRTVTEKITTESASSVSLLWVTGAVLGLLLLTTIVTVRGVTGPVRRLTEATRRLARGERDVQVPSGGASELDALGAAFNDMARQLDAARTALEGHQQRLEVQVAERTRDLRHLAENDPLTLLPNRRHLFTRLTTAIQRAEASCGGVAVMFLDVDNFKVINDSLSHEFGDQVLQQISGRLRAVVGPAGFCARLGGDEFTVVHEGAMSLVALGDLAARLVVAFEPPLRVRDQELKVTISVGVSKYPEHAGDAEGLLRAADTALFRSKERGRNQFALFNQEMLEEAARKFTIEQGLHGAIERDELRLVYQPELSLDGNRVVAVEALLRWQLADGRLVPPGEFLAIAEQSRLILDIGDWVMCTAIATAARWHRGPWPEVRIAVNVSPRQLLDGRFVARVAGLLREHALPATCLEIELTESVMQTGPATVQALRELRSLGVWIALDDFGTGYSSLASVEHLPLSRVKLDRSLVSTIDSNERSLSIAHAIIELCRGLGLAVTAEGVERPAQFALLARERDVTLQGYLFSRPVGEAEWLLLLPQVPARLEQLLLSMPPVAPLRVVAPRHAGAGVEDARLQATP
jgi:diguanylate cyclase (GGDEF)-like protein